MSKAAGKCPINPTRPLRHLHNAHNGIKKGWNDRSCNACPARRLDVRVQMIDLFESSVRATPETTFFIFVAEDGTRIPYTYKQVRLISAALARRIRKLGVHPEDLVVVDLPNCPEFIFLTLASAYGGFTLVTLKHTLTKTEKLARVLELERDGLRIGLQVDPARARELMPEVRRLSSTEGEAQEARLVESILGSSTRARSILGEERDTVDDTIHFAERAAHIFDGSARANILFTKGTASSAKTRAIPLTWTQLTEASALANKSLAQHSSHLWQEKLPLAGATVKPKAKRTAQAANVPSSASPGTGALAGSLFDVSSGSTQNPVEPAPEFFWQCVLPLYHISGFQILVRSVVGRTPLLVYERFEAEAVLNDAEACQITHITVSDRMMQDLLTVEEWRSDILPNAQSRLAAYQCILLAGHKLNPRTVGRSLDVGARLFASYGMPETSSFIATSLITPEFRGGLKLMEGYTAHIVDPDESGFGRLAVQGPGVFDGYLNASTAFTVDHYFITGDVAALYDGCIYVRNRTANMFESAGEMVYPEEIADVLRHVPGVSGAHVFGVPDPRKGRRPVAIVERDDPTLTPERVEETASLWMGEKSQLDGVVVVDHLPRTEDGKVNRIRTEEMFKNRLQVARVVLHHIRIPFKQPLKTALGTLSERDSVIVEVVDALGRRGLGECVAFGEGYGLEETLPEDVAWMRNVLVPAIKGRVFLHPREAAELASTLPGVESHPMASSAVDNALWDLYGQATERPLWQLIGEEYRQIWADAGRMNDYAKLPVVAEVSGNEALVASGAIIGLAPTPVMMENANAAVSAGYRRLKMKIAPGVGFATAEAIRRAFPNLLITLDANRSFTDDTFAELKAYDGLNIGWIEEPFDVSGGSNAVRRDPLLKMQSMQPYMATPVCADESYANVDQAERVLQFPDIRCISVKAPKLGSIGETLRFIARAKMAGRVVWMGGMYDTGVARRVAAAFETLPDMVFPGDIGALSRFFDVDVTFPAYTVEGGLVRLNPTGFDYGIGCTLNEEMLALVEVDQLVL